MLQVLGIELTTRCNLHCAHCLQQRGGADDLPLPVLEALLSQLAPYGRPVIGLTGGEPTLHPHFAQATRLIADCGHRFYVVTNAQTFEQAAPALVADAGDALTGFSFSLESPDEAEHDAVRGPGNYRRVLMALAWTAARGLEASVQTMLTPLSVPRIAQLIQLCAGLNARALYLSHLIPTPSATAAGLVLSLSERAAAEAEARRVGAECGIAVHLGVGSADPSPLLACPFTTGEQLFVNARGQVCLCCQLSHTVGSDDGAEVIADLATTALLQAHEALCGRLAALQASRLRAARLGELTPADTYPCLYCMRVLGRLPGLDPGCRLS